MERLVIFWICFYGILNFRALVTLFEVDKHGRTDDITFISSGCFRERLIFLLPISFLKRSFLWLLTFCSEFFLWTLLGLLSTYWPKSVSPFLFRAEFGDIRVANAYFGFVGLHFDTGCWTVFSNHASRSQNIIKAVQMPFWRCVAWIFLAIFTWMLRFVLGIGQEIPSDHISLASSLFIFCCSFF